MGRAVGYAQIFAILLLGLLALGAPQKYRDEFHPANETGRIHAAMAIVDHGTAHLDAVWDDVYPGWRTAGRLPNNDASIKDDHFLLDKPPGVTFFILPVIGLLRAFGIETGYSTLVWLLALLLAALPSVLFLLHFRRWIRAGFTNCRAVGFIAPAVVIASPWLLFGAQLAGHTLAASLAGIGAFLTLGRLGAETPGGSDRPGGLIGGLALGAAALVEASSALLALGTAVALLTDPARRRRLPWLILGGLGPAIAFLAWNAVVFGDPLTYGYAHKATASMAEAHGRGVLGLGAPDPNALFGLLLSAKRGLFFLAPWLVLGPLGAIWACRDRSIARAWRVLVLIGAVLIPILMSGFSDWHGGQTIGPRYLLFTLPFFGIGAALAVDRLRRRRLGRPAMAIVSGLVISSLAILLVCQIGVPAVAPEVENPVIEVLIPVLIESGTIGTILDPILGAVPATALMVLAAFALLLLGAARPGEQPAADEPDAPRGSARWTATVLVAAAVVTHLIVVVVPRTEAPEAKEAMLDARAYSFLYLGDDEARFAAEAEAERIRRRKPLPSYPSSSER